MPTLLIVDHHVSFRGFALSLLSAEGWEVTGEAGDGEQALVEVERLHPDVVLVDVQLPGMDGFEVAERLNLRTFPPRVILTSSREASDFDEQLRASSADGFIAKHELSGDALTAVLAAR